MLRRKKLKKLALKKKAVPSKTKQEKQYDEMISTIVKNVKKRKSNKSIKEQKRQEWLSTRAKNFELDILEPRKEWLDGKSTKTSVFDPVNFNNVDVDAINEKRKLQGISSGIEEASMDAIENAKQKAKRIVLACPKSAYQYIGTDKQTLKDLGKKSSQLEE